MVYFIVWLIVGIMTTLVSIILKDSCDANLEYEQIYFYSVMWPVALVVFAIFAAGGLCWFILASPFMLIKFIVTKLIRRVK